MKLTCAAGMLPRLSRHCSAHTQSSADCTQAATLQRACLAGGCWQHSIYAHGMQARLSSKWSMNQQYSMRACKLCSWDASVQHRMEAVRMYAGITGKLQGSCNTPPGCFAGSEAPSSPLICTQPNYETWGVREPQTSS